MRAAFDNLPLNRRERLAFGLIFVGLIAAYAAGIALLASRLHEFGVI